MTLHPIAPYLDGARAARRIAHECRREGNPREFRRHMIRARGYLRSARCIREIHLRFENMGDSNECAA